MTLTLVGLGLGDCEDITIKGYNAVKNADFVYLEVYTSCLTVGKEVLEGFYGKEIIEADRDLVEQENEALLSRSLIKQVVLLVAGDPFCATTHSDIALRAKQMGVVVHVIHNASVMTAIGSCGLQMYRFGQTVSIPFFEGKWKPDSFYDKILTNKNSNLHTLCLLDIKYKEQTLENMMKGNKIYEPPRYMTVNQSIEQLLEIESSRKQNVYSKNSKAYGVARLGSNSELIVAGKLEDLLGKDFGLPLHSLILCAPELHEMEEEYYMTFQ